MKNRFCIPIRTQWKWITKFVFLIAFLFVCHVVLAKAPKDLSEAMRLFGQQKSMSEEWAFILKKEIRPNISPRLYIRARSLYIDAKSAFDGLIEKMIFDLTTDNITAYTEEYEKHLELAATKSEIFTTYVEALADDVVLGGIVAKIVTNILRDITESGIKIWKEFRQMRQEKRQGIIRQLEHLKWKPFDEIPGG